jgi:hypothetical protein
MEDGGLVNQFILTVAVFQILVKTEDPERPWETMRDLVARDVYQAWEWEMLSQI